MNLYAFATANARREFSRQQQDHADAPLTVPCPHCGSLCDKHDLKANGKPAYHCRNRACRQPWPFGHPASQAS